MNRNPHGVGIARDFVQDRLPEGHLVSDRYEIGPVLGTGGFGITYRARDTEDDVDVCVKEYFPKDPQIGREDDGSVVVRKKVGFWGEKMYSRWKERFIREGKVLSQLDHDNIVRVQTVFEAAGTAYIVMELLEGTPLIDVMEYSSVGEDQLEVWMDLLVDAVAQVHGRGFYHLDISPLNIMITDDQRPVLIDFGAAKPHSPGAQSTIATNLNYAPPELLSSERTGIGAHTDIYELGTVVYHVLTDRLPPNWARRPSNWMPDVPDRWRTLVRTALKIEPGTRPDDVREWWALLGEKGEPKKRTKVTEKAAIDDIVYTAKDMRYKRQWVQNRDGTTAVRKVSHKHKWLAFLFAFPLGIIGLHYLYAGRPIMTLRQIIALPFLVGFVWWARDLSDIVRGDFEDHFGALIR